MPERPATRPEYHSSSEADATITFEEYEKKLDLRTPYTTEVTSMAIFEGSYYKWLTEDEENSARKNLERRPPLLSRMYLSIRLYKLWNFLFRLEG